MSAARSFDRVWYVAYGSNVSRQRFQHYLVGGRPRGSKRFYAGARDGSPPIDDRPMTLPGQVYFAGDSPTWGGGIAFYDPAAEDVAGEVAARGYLVTSGQFSDVANQETRRPVGLDLPLAQLFGDSRSAVLGPGRYETLLHVGERDGVPMLTFTASWDHAAAALNAPVLAYLSIIAEGLMQTHHWSPERCCDYLTERPGVLPAWSRTGLLDALHNGVGRAQNG